MTNENDRQESITFHVIDNTTGEEADAAEIARTEEWAKHLMAMDVEGFALEEDGMIMLVDECGQFAYCPEGRFTIRFNGTPEQIKKHDDAVRADAVQAERTRDIAGEVWDLLVEHLPAKGRTDIYDKMREAFPIPSILSDDKEASHDEAPEREETLQEYPDRQDGADIDLEHGSN